LLSMVLQSLSDLWAAHCRAGDFQLTLKIVERDLKTHLEKHGFDVPVRAKIEAELTGGLGPCRW